MKKITVNINKNKYNILIQKDILRYAHKYMPHVIFSDKLLILSTHNIYKKHGYKLLKSLKKIGKKIYVYLIPDGEIFKNQKYLFSVLNKMSELGFQRDSCLIALGGGVIGDLGGFAASIYMRGIEFVQCPTTLLAQVDASIGGKTAVDFYGIKNLIGSFYQPKMVLADTKVINTLTERQFRTGLAEIIKHGIVLDPKLFCYLEKNLKVVLKRNPIIMQTVIARSCKIKALIVSEDEKEVGKRMWLNYGHTLGHALEAYYGYQLLTHGEAVAYGIRFASLLSIHMRLCDSTVVARQYDLLKRAGLFRKVPAFDKNKIYQKMFLDKKSRKGGIQFVLTRKIGLVSIQENVPKPVVFSALNQLQAEASENH